MREERVIFQTIVTQWNNDLLIDKLICDGTLIKRRVLFVPYRLGENTPPITVLMDEPVKVCPHMPSCSAVTGETVYVLRQVQPVAL
jgi:hypothetical protein